jgi:hypothetical protein
MDSGDPKTPGRNPMTQRRKATLFWRRHSDQRRDSDWRRDSDQRTDSVQRRDRVQRRNNE